MKPEWIPMSRPPRMIGRYLITRRHRHYAEFGSYYPQSAKWVDSYGEEINDVIGWMHAPEPMMEDDQ
jgi:hypothetical protein